LVSLASCLWTVCDVQHRICHIQTIQNPEDIGLAMDLSDFALPDHRCDVLRVPLRLHLHNNRSMCDLTVAGPASTLALSNDASPSPPGRDLAQRRSSRVTT
jgi:hypothetical protein